MFAHFESAFGAPVVCRWPARKAQLVGAIDDVKVCQWLSSSLEAARFVARTGERVRGREVPTSRSSHREFFVTTQVDGTGEHVIDEAKLRDELTRRFRGECPFAYSLMRTVYDDRLDDVACEALVRCHRLDSVLTEAPTVKSLIVVATPIFEYARPGGDLAFVIRRCDVLQEDATAAKIIKNTLSLFEIDRARRYLRDHAYPNILKEYYLRRFMRFAKLSQSVVVQQAFAAVEVQALTVDVALDFDDGDAGLGDDASPAAGGDSETSSDDEVPAPADGDAVDDKIASLEAKIASMQGRVEELKRQKREG